MIFLFSSNSGTMVATKALRDSGVEARILPTPAGAASSAHLCLSIEDAVEARALAALQSAKVGVTVLR